MTVSINTYREFDQFVGAWTTGNVNLLTLEGPGGVSKTQTVREALAKKGVDHFYMSGYTTKLAFVEDLYKNADKLIVIDDVDTMLRDRALVAILKQLCDTVPVKRIKYRSTDYRAQLIPEEFETRSKVLIIVNSLGRVNADIAAFLTRGLFIKFNPHIEEIMKRLHTFAEDKEVLSFFDGLAWQLSRLDLRAYGHAVELKNAGLNWKEIITEDLEIDPDAEIALRITKEGGSFKKRSEKFTTETGKSYRTYARYLEKLAVLGIVKVTGQGKSRKVST